MTAQSIFKGLRSIQVRDPLVVVADNFRNGPCGWRGLVNGTSAQGTVLPSTMPTSGEAALRMGIEDGGSSYNPDVYAMALKRFTLPYDPATNAFRQYVTFEADIAVAAYWNTAQRWNSPRAIDIGIDHGWGTDAGGTNDNRSFICARYLIVDEANSNAVVQKFQMRTSPDHGATTTYTDLLDSGGNTITYPIGYNENKANVFKIKIMADITSHRLVGLAVNSRGYGMLDQTVASGSAAAQCLYNIGQAWSGHLNQGGVPSFYGGMNACVELYGRTNSGQTAADLFISNPRVEAVAA